MCNPTPHTRRRAESRRGSPARRRWPRLWLDRLEDRAVPTQVVWDGGPTGQGTTWLDPANWAGDRLPGPTDDAFIEPAAEGQPEQIVLSGSTAVHSANVGRTLRFNGGAL